MHAQLKAAYFKFALVHSATHEVNILTLFWGNYEMLVATLISIRAAPT
jgi:hypothetical protein